MEQGSLALRLRYLGAGDVDDGVVDFDGLDVRGQDSEKLGQVNGFIVDLATGRVLYLVIDSGGWFRTRRFLAPIGHAAVDRAANALSLDITRERLAGYPEFDETRFSQFSDADLLSFDARMAAICCPDEQAGGDGATAYDTRRHYRQPDWWTGGAYAHERLRPVESPAHRVFDDATR